MSLYQCGVGANYSIHFYRIGLKGIRLAAVMLGAEKCFMVNGSQLANLKKAYSSHATAMKSVA